MWSVRSHSLCRREDPSVPPQFGAIGENKPPPGRAAVDSTIQVLYPGLTAWHAVNFNMYHARQISELTPIARHLADDGIAIVRDIYSVSDIAEINSAMNSTFKAKENESRSYIRPDGMNELGIMGKILSENMMNVLFSIMPDPVLYHMHAYEIRAKSSEPHIFSDNLEGWHRDPDSAYFAGDPTHVSVFVYLSNVGQDDGAFEFSPEKPDHALASGSQVATMTGQAGLSFVWHRSFHHRASPNRGVRRRRLIKISVQRNEFESVHLKQPFFRRMIERAPHGDLRMDILLGRFQNKKAPKLTPAKIVDPEPVRAFQALNLPASILQKIAKVEAAPAGSVAYD